MTTHHGICILFVFLTDKCFPSAQLFTEQVGLQRTMAKIRFKNIYRAVALPPCRVCAAQTKMVSVRWDQVTLVFASYFRATVSS